MYLIQELPDPQVIGRSGLSGFVQKQDSGPLAKVRKSGPVTKALLRVVCRTSLFQCDNQDLLPNGLQFLPFRQPVLPAQIQFK